MSNTRTWLFVYAVRAFTHSNDVQVNISDAASLLKKIKSLARDTVSIMADWRPLYNGDEPSGEKGTGRGSVADIEGRGGWLALWRFSSRRAFETLKRRRRAMRSHGKMTWSVKYGRGRQHPLGSPRIHIFVRRQARHSFPHSRILSSRQNISGWS